MTNYQLQDKLRTDERKVVDNLLSQGKNVEIIPKSNIHGVTTPDFRVNGVKTELKTIENVNTNTGMKRIQEAFNKQHAEAVIIDARSTNLSTSQAQEIIQRAAGKYPDKQLPGTVEIWTNNGIITYP